jgi:5-formyltetrahydrofolate cyclo-ligase
MAVPSPITKEQLRKAALERRRSYARSLSSDLRAEMEARLAGIVAPHLAGVGAVGGYFPMKAEISPLPVLEALGGSQAAGLPWFADRDSRMIFRRAPAVEPGPWGMLQPAGDAEIVVPDLVLVPLVLADRHGTRIGHGKGHYDRALAHLRESGRHVRTIGIAWEMQVVDEPLPADPWDQPLDAIATPGEWIQCR